MSMNVQTASAPATAIPAFLVESAKPFDWKAEISDASDYDHIESVFRRVFPITGGRATEAQKEDYKEKGTKAKAFKGWFGDWEKAAKKRRFYAMQPVTIDASVFGDEKDAARLRDIGKKEYEKIVSQTGSVTNKETNRKIIFTSEQFKKPESHSADPRIMKIIPALPGLLENAILLESEKEKYPEKYRNIKAWHSYGVRAVLDGQPLLVRISTFELASGEEVVDSYHDHNVLWEEYVKRGSNAGPDPTTNRAVTQETLLRNKLYQWFQDVKPENISKVVKGDGSPQDTYDLPQPITVYHGTAAGGFKSFDKDKQDDASLYGPGFYFTEDKTVADEYQKKDVRYELDQPLNKELYNRIFQWFQVTENPRRSSPFVGSFDFQLWRSSENDLPALAEYLAQMPTSYVASLIRGTFGLTLHRAESKAETKACYLNIKKPFDLDSKSGTELDPDEVDRIMQVAADMGYMGDHPRNGRPFYVYDALLQCRNIAILNQGQTVPLRSKMSKADANKVLRRVGYDGITHIGGNLMGGGEKQHRVWIAFEPNQVKAIDNEGGFTDSDNIYEAAAEYDWRKAVADAGAFDDILNVFDNIFGFDKYRFAQSLLREAQTKKVHAAIAMLESGNPEPEARYFALSQIQSLLYASDIGSDEAASIRAKYDDQFAGKEKALSDHYAGKGEEAKRAAGIQDAIQQHAALGEEIKAIVARHVEAIDRIHAEFAPALSEANAKHIEPLIQKKDIAQRAYEEKRTELINRRPSADKVQSQLSPEEYTKFVEWQNESGKLHREFAAEQQVIIDELRWAKFTYITPIEHEELLKQGNAVNEIGDTGQLREDQKGIAKEAHAKLMAQLLEQSPVTEEQATEWISQNAIMDKNAIAKAKKAGYDPKDVTKDLVEFYRITGGRLPRLAYATTRNARSMASPHAGNLYVGSSFGKKTFFHELAHLLEGDPKIFNCAQQFLGRRAESSQTYSLSSLTKNSNYRGDERAYKDKWIDPYVGKVYPDATEVFSMGMSTLADPESLINVLNKDPEHLSLMLGVCLSKPYIDEDRKQVLQGEVREKKANIQKTDDFYKEIDKKIAKAGNFWEGHIVAITPQVKYGATRPSGYLLSYETKKNSQTYSVFKSEKDMKRALYLWISNDKPPAGPFSINELNYTLGYKKNLLPKEFLNFPIREVPN